MGNPKQYSDKIKRKEDEKKSGLQAPLNSSIINPLIEPHFKSIHDGMEISQPGDHSEMLADEMANSFMRGGEYSQHVSAPATSDISRKGEDGDIETSDAFHHELQSTKGQGQKLDEGVKGELEEHTGTDLTNVNVHTSPKAEELSEGINAKAFTHGQDIYFNNGNYNPASDQGKELLAHEVTHTMQQEKGVRPKIQRSMKFELQTGNFVWKVNAAGTTPTLLPRRYSPSGKTEESGNKPSYLSLGTHGGPAMKKGTEVFSEVEGSPVMEIARTNIMVEAIGVTDSLPAQYVVPILVWNLDAYLENGEVPEDKDLVPLKILNREAFMLPGSLPEGAYNKGTYEFKYYNAATYLEAHPIPVDFLDWDNEDLRYKNADTYFKNVKAFQTFAYDDLSYENVHRDKRGAFKAGHVKFMMEKPTEYSAEKDAQFIKEYKFKSQVILKDIIGEDPAEGQMELISETNNADIDTMKGKYNPNTFEYKYYNADGTPLLIHQNEKGTFKKGHVKLMKVGTPDSYAQESGLPAQYTQEITVYGITNENELLGKTVEQLQKEKPLFKIEEKELVTNKGSVISDTYDFYYLTNTGNFLNVHRDTDGTFQSGYVQFMEKTTLEKDTEQTAIELQSEHGGYIEFETPRWYNKWPELQISMQDAVDMTKAIDGARKLDDSVPEDKIILDSMKRQIGTKSANEAKKIYNQAHPNAPKPMTTLIEKGERDSELGDVHEWPAAYSYDQLKTPEAVGGGRLLAEVVDKAWGAKIQGSEGIALSEYNSLQTEHEGAAYAKTRYDWATNIFNTAFAAYKLKPENAGKQMDESLFADLKGFLQLIVTYIFIGQTDDLYGSPSKYGFALMARTNFASMFMQLLNTDEKALFKDIVADKTNPILTQVNPAIDTERKTKYDDYKTRAAATTDLTRKAHLLAYMAIWKKITLNRTSLFFFRPFGDSQKTVGPTIYNWLVTLQSTIKKVNNGKEIITQEVEGKDLLSGAGFSSAMGARTVENQPGNKDYKLAEFEVRASVSTATTLGDNDDVKANNWIAYAKQIFDQAKARSADTPDDVSTPGVNEASKTSLR
jgi:hypothetical protein